MKLFLDSILAILFALSVLVMFGMLFAPTTSATSTTAGATRRIRSLSFWKDAGVTGWITAIIAGAAFFIINNLIIGKWLSYKTIWVAWVILAVILSAFLALSVLWHKGGTKFREAIAFVVVAGFLVAPMKTFIGTIMAPTSLTTEAISRVAGSISTIVFLAFVTYVLVRLIMEMKRHGNNEYMMVRKIVITAVVVLFAVIILVCLTGCNASDWKPQESQTESQTESSLSDEEMEKAIAEAKEDLTIPKITAGDLEKLTVGKYKNIPEILLDYSLSPRDKERTEKSGFSDALTLGFSDTKDNTKMFKELEEEILCNPVYGVTVAKALKDKKLGDETIGNLNPWMREMINKNNAGLFTWCEYRDAEKKTIYLTEEYRIYAATLCTLLERFVEQGIEQRDTIENWCLNETVKNNDRAGVKADYQYKKDSFVLAYVLKNGQKILIIGFNVHDKRPEFFEEETPPPPPESSVPESSVPEVPTDESSEPPCSEPEYSKPESSQPSKPESSQPSKPESSEPSRPESSEPSKPTPEPSKPTPEPSKPTPEPSKPESSVPYNKDPSKAPKTNTEPNDVSGPGPDTNNGKGATESKKDKSTNSNKYPSYEEYKKDMEEMSRINETQKTGNDSNTPSTKPKKQESVVVDDNGDKGTGNGGINTPTPQTSSAETADGRKIADDKPGQAWGGPPD